LAGTDRGTAKKRQPDTSLKEKRKGGKTIGKGVSKLRSTGLLAPRFCDKAPKSHLKKGGQNPALFREILSEGVLCLSIIAGKRSANRRVPHEPKRRWARKDALRRVHRNAEEQKEESPGED